MADYNSSLPVRTETAGDVDVNIYDSTGANAWSIDASGIGQVNLNDGTNSLVIGAGGQITTIVTDGTDTIAIDGSGNLSTLVTDGTDTLEINTDGSTNTVITDGTDTLAVNTDGSINVNVVETTAGDEVHVYDTTASAVPGTPETVVDYTVTTAKTLLLKSYYAACSGKAKFEIKTGPAASEVTRHIGFLSTSSGDKQITFPQPLEVVAGDKVLVIVTNNDKANADVYAAINGTEV